MPKGHYLRKSQAREMDLLGLSLSNHKRAKKYYKSQLRGSKRRKIPWDFTFIKWVNWWHQHLGPNWLNYRGRFKGQYVMARNGDKGPYAKWNVKCILSTQNLLDRKMNGTSGGGRKNVASMR